MPFGKKKLDLEPDRFTLSIDERIITAPFGTEKLDAFFSYATSVRPDEDISGCFNRALGILKQGFQAYKTSLLKQRNKEKENNDEIV
jgi:hypothetical protein